jgi:hypothetical protein
MSHYIGRKYGRIDQEGPAEAHIQALNLTEGMGAPAMAGLA